MMMMGLEPCLPLGRCVLGSGFWLLSARALIPEMNPAADDFCQRLGLRNRQGRATRASLRARTTYITHHTLTAAQAREQSNQQARLHTDKLLPCAPTRMCSPFQRFQLRPWNDGCKPNFWRASRLLVSEVGRGPGKSDAKSPSSWACMKKGALSLPLDVCRNNLTQLVHTHCSVLSVMLGKGFAIASSTP